MIFDSLQYTSHGKEEDGTFYMLLCEVSLGNIANYSNDWNTDDIYRPPLSCHSIRIMGEKGPDFHHNLAVWD